ncbi:MAG: hypothetical protein JWM59_3528, partial [Verrucomicrobiales bacterium]|nr:hypothetical protein [Verrucomicrobiales bacterium]
ELSGRGKVRDGTLEASKISKKTGFIG